MTWLAKASCHGGHLAGDKGISNVAGIGVGSVEDGRQLADSSLVDQPTIGFRSKRFSASESRSKSASIGQRSPGEGTVRPRGATPKGGRYMMQATLRALGWGLERLG